MEYNTDGCSSQSAAGCPLWVPDCPWSVLASSDCVRSMQEHRHARTHRLFSRNMPPGLIKRAHTCRAPYDHEDRALCPAATRLRGLWQRESGSRSCSGRPARHPHWRRLQGRGPYSHLQGDGTSQSLNEHFSACTQIPVIYYPAHPPMLSILSLDANGAILGSLPPQLREITPQCHQTAAGYRMKSMPWALS